MTESVMIALLPTTTEWCKMELPHLTLVYAGPVEDLKGSVFNDMCKKASSISMLTNPLYLKVTGSDVFGEEEKFDVLTLEKSQELLSIREILEHWDASDFDFSPHCTIGPIGTNNYVNPMFLTFDRLVVAWGEKQLTFWLRK